MGLTKPRQPSKTKMASTNLVRRLLLSPNRNNFIAICKRLGSTTAGGHSQEWHATTPNVDRASYFPGPLKFLHPTPFLSEEDPNHGHYYRKIPIQHKKIIFLAEFLATVIWTWIWFHVFTEGGHLVVSFKKCILKNHHRYLLTFEFR